MPRATALALTALLAALAAAAPAWAGPPLVCHVLEIGGAESLPFAKNGWNAPDPAYDRSKLLGDIERILDGGAPVLARMETLRRASVYVQRDSTRATELWLLLARRAKASEIDAKTAALRTFDLGYLTGVYVQLDKVRVDRERIGVALTAEYAYGKIADALVRTGPSPEMEFAAALASWWPKRPEHRAHLERAREANHALVAKNLAGFFD